MLLPLVIGPGLLGIVAKRNNLRAVVLAFRVRLAGCLMVRALAGNQGDRQILLKFCLTNANRACYRSFALQTIEVRVLN